MRRAEGPSDAEAEAVGLDLTLLDAVDNLLNHGVVLDGELLLGVAGIDLIYLRLSLLLCASDRLFHGQERRP